jgi:V8-like Glu-specific endopeptidase
VTHPDLFPFRTVAKLFLQTSDGPQTASGFIVYDRFAITAGHCIQWGGRSTSSVRISPSYTNGNEPFGSWLACNAWMPPEWSSTNDFGYDVAVLKVSPNANNLAIGAATGFLGTTGGLSGETWIGVGYPGNYAHGEDMFAQSGTFTRAIQQPGGGYLIGRTGSFGGGASGGPWALNSLIFSPYNGLQSCTSAAYPDEVFSPFFSAELVDWIVNTIRQNAD